MNLTRFPRHITHISIPKEDPCGYILKLPEEDKCQFVIDTTQCHVMIRLFDYMYFLFCVCKSSIPLRWLGVFALIFYVLILLNFMRILSTKSFTPIMLSMGKHFRLSEILTGFFIFGIGSSLSEVYWSFREYKGDSSEMYYISLFGCSCFDVGLTVGILMLFGSFRYSNLMISRDSLVIIIISAWLTTTMYRRQVHLFEAIAMMLFFVFYSGALIIEYLYMKKKFLKTIELFKEQDEYVLPKKYESKMILLKSFCLFNRKGKFFDDELDKIGSLRYSKFEGKSDNERLLRQFVHDLRSFNPIHWKSMKWNQKFFLIIDVPLKWICKIFLPTMNYCKRRHGWSKLLVMINCVTMPMGSFWIIGRYLDYWYFPFALGVITSMIVFFTSRTDRAPDYLIVLGCYGFIGNTLFLYGVSSEVGNVLACLGTVIGLEPATIGLIIIAWEESLPNFIITLTLADRGYLKMAFAMIYGGTIYTMYFQNGLRYFIKCFSLHSNVIFIRGGESGPTASFYLILIVFFTSIAFLLTKSVSRRSFGYFLIIIYVIFIANVLLIDREYIHPYGTDHDEEILIED